MRMKSILRILGTTLFVLFAVSRPVFAACSGSGLTWTCPSGASAADVTAAYNAGTDGMTITFAPGSYSFSGVVFSASKGVTMICATAPNTVGAATVNPCNMTSYSVFGTGLVPVTGTTVSKLYRISGFTFASSGAGHWSVYFCNQGGCTGTMTQIRVDHNTFAFRSADSAILMADGLYYGVVDHNLMTSSGSAQLLLQVGGIRSPAPSSPQGTANNMFIEDNTINITTLDNAGDGCVDGWGENDWVIRHNTSLNCLWTTHGAKHEGGPQSVEFYNNSVRLDAGSVGAGVQDCYRCFHHQGSGELLLFNNTFTPNSGHSGDVYDIQDYRGAPNANGDASMPICDGTVNRPSGYSFIGDGNRSPATTYRGYPCWHQLGRDFATSPVGGNLVPMYQWSNLWSDGTNTHFGLAGSGSPDYTTNHLQQNRDWFDSVSASAQTTSSSPFNGTTGMGFGTLATRPTSCSTAGTDPGDAGHGGVGYFAVDSGAMGTLYTCTSTNTWTKLYSPYTYPHPLVSGTQSQPPPQAPPAPTNPRILP